MDELEAFYYDGTKYTILDSYADLYEIQSHLTGVIMQRDKDIVDDLIKRGVYELKDKWSELVERMKNGWIKKGWYF